jgi:hypothetical protein
MLGKDFVSAFIVLWFFISRHPCRVVTTSADFSQLNAVLWGEIKRFIQEARYPLDYAKGGPLLVNQLFIRKMAPVHDMYGNQVMRQDGIKLMQVDGLSYVQGRVALKGEGMLGHHIADIGDGVPRTLWVADESSGVADVSYERATTWARRILAIGNPFPAANFFEKGVKQGDILAEDAEIYKAAQRPGEDFRVKGI